MDREGLKADIQQLGETIGMMLQIAPIENVKSFVDLYFSDNISEAELSNYTKNENKEFITIKVKPYSALEFIQVNFTITKDDEL